MGFFSFSFVCMLLLLCVGKGILVPCGDERGRENEKDKKKLWVQGLYRLRRHGGERVLSCIASCLEDQILSALEE